MYPQADHQRCWVHNLPNVLACFPKRPHGEATARMREMYEAKTKAASLALMQQFAGT